MRRRDGVRGAGIGRSRGSTGRRPAGARNARGCGRFGLALLLLAAWGFAAEATPVAAQGSPSGGDEDPMAILDAAAARYDRLNGFCASFEQERVVPLLKQTTESRGTLCQMQPGFFLMDFSEPEGDRVVSDGRNLWVYYPSVDPDQVIRTRLGGMGTTYDFHAEFLKDPAVRFEAEYLGRETVTGRETRVLSLRPLEPSGYETAKVWLEVDRGLIRKVEIEEENGSIRRITLSDIRLDPGLDADRFAFRPPDGVRVLDQNLPSTPR